MSEMIERIAGYERYNAAQRFASEPVPGVGPILGVRCFQDVVYAVRSDGEVPVLYAATKAGWERVSPIWDEVLCTLGESA